MEACYHLVYEGVGWGGGTYIICSPRSLTVTGGGGGVSSFCITLGVLTEGGNLISLQGSSGESGGKQRFEFYLGRALVGLHCNNIENRCFENLGLFGKYSPKSGCSCCLKLHHCQKAPVEISPNGFLLNKRCQHNFTFICKIISRHVLSLFSSLCSLPGWSRFHRSHRSEQTARGPIVRIRT